MVPFRQHDRRRGPTSAFYQASGRAIETSSGAGGTRARIGRFALGGPHDRPGRFVVERLAASGYTRQSRIGRDVFEDVGGD